MLCAILTVVFALKLLGFVAFTNGEFGNNLFAFLVTSFCGSFAVIIFSSLISKISFLEKGLSYIGRNSLIIFGLHMFVIVLVLRICSRVFNRQFSAQVNLPVALSIALTIFSVLLLTGLTFLVNAVKMSIKNKQKKSSS